MDIRIGQCIFILLCAVPTLVAQDRGQFAGAGGFPDNSRQPNVFDRAAVLASASRKLAEARTPEELLAAEEVLNPLVGRTGTSLPYSLRGTVRVPDEIRKCERVPARKCESRQYGVGGGEIGRHFRGEKGATNSVEKGTGSKLGTGMHGRNARPQGSAAPGAGAAKVAPFLAATDIKNSLNTNHPSVGYNRQTTFVEGQQRYRPAPWPRASEGSWPAPEPRTSKAPSPWLGRYLRTETYRYAVPWRTCTGAAFSGRANREPTTSRF